MPRPRLTIKASHSVPSTFINHHHQPPTQTHFFHHATHTSRVLYHSITVHSTMPLPRGGSRFFRAARSAIAWPICVKVEPFSTPDIDQIPFWEKTHLTTSYPRLQLDSDYADAWSERLRGYLVNREDNTLAQPGMFHSECYTSTPFCFRFVKYVLGNQNFPRLRFISLPDF